MGFHSLSFLDSVRVADDNQFFGSTFQARLIGDSLIAVSSFMTPGIWIIETQTGKIVSSISSGEIMNISFFPSNFDVSYYPRISLLDGQLKSVFHFDFAEKKFLKRVDLEFPNDRSARLLDSYYKELDEGYLVELYTREISNTDPSYYSQVRGLIGQFDANGELASSFLDFPDLLSKLKSPIMPYQTFGQSYGIGYGLKVAFPASGQTIHLNREEDEGWQLVESSLPESSHFQSAPPTLERRYNPKFDNFLDFPSSHFYKVIIENGEGLYIQTDMRDNDKLGEYESVSHIVAFDKRGGLWSETNTPIDLNRLGLLAGAVSDTLYFFEGSMKWSEAKYIKRAVLRPIEE